MLFLGGADVSIKFEALFFFFRVFFFFFSGFFGFFFGFEVGGFEIHRFFLFYLNPLSFSAANENTQVWRGRVYD